MLAGIGLIAGEPGHRMAFRYGDIDHRKISFGIAPHDMAGTGLAIEEPEIDVVALNHVIGGQNAMGANNQPRSMTALMFDQNGGSMQEGNACRRC
jgi:hypothetical protein